MSQRQHFLSQIPPWHRLIFAEEIPAHHSSKAPQNASNSCLALNYRDGFQKARALNRQQMVPKKVWHETKLSPGSFSGSCSQTHWISAGGRERDREHLILFCSVLLQVNHFKCLNPPMSSSSLLLSINTQHRMAGAIYDPSFIHKAPHVVDLNQNNLKNDSLAHYPINKNNSRGCAVAGLMSEFKQTWPREGCVYMKSR